jgi:hypothetical protein
MNALPRSTPRLATLLLAVAAWLPCAPVHAGLPLHTDDAGVLAVGACELEGTAVRATAADARTTDTSLQLGCGVGWRSAVTLARASNHGADAPVWSLGGKTGLWQGDGAPEHAAALTLAGTLQQARLPGSGWRHTGTGLNLIASVPLAGSLTLHANLGHARDEPARQGSTTWGLAIEQTGPGSAPRWAPMAEVYGDDRERPWWNLGLRVALVPERHFVVVGYGRQFSRERPGALTLGLKATF